MSRGHTPLFCHRGIYPARGWWESVGASPTASPTPPHHPGWPIQHGRAHHVRAAARQREVCARDLRPTFVRQPKRIGQEGVPRAVPRVPPTFLASTTHGVEVALECPARPAADGQAGARALSSPHLLVSTPGGRAPSERSSTTPTQRLSTSGQVGGSGWRSTARMHFKYAFRQKNMQTHATRVLRQQQQHKNTIKGYMSSNF